MQTKLSYTETTSRPVEKTVQLQIPKEWGMYTAQGNKSLTKKAEILVSKIESTTSTIERLALFAKFFKSYRKMSQFKSFRGAGDTAVRECVWDFALEVGKCVGIDYSTLDNIWDSADAHPERVRK
jgi:hypothetical protein